MLKRKELLDRCAAPEQGADEDEEVSSVPLTKRRCRKVGMIEESLDDGHDVSTKYKLKQRTLVFSTQGTTHRDRHLMQDIRDLLPHSRSESKLDSKRDLALVTELCDLRNCNNCIFFDARRKLDLYMWVAKTPHGPSAKFRVQNIHTMAELKLTGNCLKGSRHMLVFDDRFVETPHGLLFKELLTQVFCVHRGHPKSKPFVDHVFSFFLVDGRIWFRNYQIIYDADGSAKKSEEGDPVLVEVGPRFVLQPIKVLSGSFSGSTIYSNTEYITPTRERLLNKKNGRGNGVQQPSRYEQRIIDKLKREKKLAASKDCTTELDKVFRG